MALVDGDIVPIRFDEDGDSVEVRLALVDGDCVPVRLFDDGGSVPVRFDFDEGDDDGAPTGTQPDLFSFRTSPVGH